MYTYRRLDPTRLTFSPPAPPNSPVLMPMLKTKHFMLTARPADSASRRQLLVNPELLPPPMGDSESWTSEEMVNTSSSEISVTEQN